MVVCACNARIAVLERSPDFGWVPGQARLHSETLSQTQKQIIHMHKHTHTYIHGHIYMCILHSVCMYIRICVWERHISFKFPMDFEETDLSQFLITYSFLRWPMNIPFWQEHTIDKRLQMAIWTTLSLLFWANNCFNEVTLMPNHEGKAQTNHPKSKVVIYIRLCSTNNWLIINKSIKQANSTTFWSIYLAVNYLWGGTKCSISHS